MDTLFDFGMIGLGVMGRNLLLNMADHGFKVIGFDKDATKNQALESSANAGAVVKGVDTLEAFTSQLSRPRRIMMLVPAGKPVDDVIESLIPLVQPGDVLIDGGNSHYVDTVKRIDYCQSKGIRFMGMGVSGGEQGARLGPSLMPGGDQEAYNAVKPILESVAAKVNGEPCVDYLGKGAAGHYVKMVHNGIEYAIMQLISETYELLRHGGGLGNDELHRVFADWNAGESQSFLIEITADIFLQPDDRSDQRLLDLILDKAGAKGTGKWTSQDGMDLGVPIPTIDVAVSMRNISALKSERTSAATLYKTNRSVLNIPSAKLIQYAHDALYLGTLASYAQGLSLLQAASLDYDMQIPIHKVVQVWRGGCIIRSAMLHLFSAAFEQNPSLHNLLLDPAIAEVISAKLTGTRTLLSAALAAGYPVAAHTSALGYFDAYTSAQLPVNLLQAQRDYFGAHTYQRIDVTGTFHTEWGSLQTAEKP